MIRTNYNALGNYTFDTKSRVYEGVSKGAKVKELQKNLTKLGYDTNGIDEMKFIVPTAAGHLLSGCVIV